MSHYYTKKQTSISKPKLIRVRTKTDEFELYSDHGIFSKDKLDKGTEVLINTTIKLNLVCNKVLDLGCGYGVVGISLLRNNKSLTLTFSDVNERALSLTEKNLKFLKLKGEIKLSDGYSNIKDNFDFVLTNPPFAAGKKVCTKLIQETHEHLKKNGRIVLVARRKKGGETLAGIMEEIFGNVETINKKSGYGVYVSIKN